MSESVDTNENFGIIIEKYHIDPNYKGLFVDVDIEKGDFCIYHIPVDYENGIYTVKYPENWCPATGRSFDTMRFNRLKTWIYIKEEIIKIIKKEKWIKVFFEEE